MSKYPVALTIAGSDSGGGAGIQADLKTFAMHCVHGASAITCVTAQNTVEVTDVVAMSPSCVTAQIRAVASDLEVKATKTGMLLQPELIEAVAREIQNQHLSPLVVDPVMVSRSGQLLITEQAITHLTEQLIPQALLVTPNLYEAQILSGLTIDNLTAMSKAAEKIKNLGAGTVLIKGGALPGELKGVDLWYDGESTQILKTETVATNHTHGTGCTLAAAITANLALGKSLLTAVVAAKEYVTTALQACLAIGQGPGPVGHFFPLLGTRIGKIWE